MEVAADQLVDVAVERGGEEHPLAVGAHLVERFGDLRQEPQVAHLVGLVEHGDPYPSQAAGVALDQVVQASGGGDDHLGSLAQRGGLAADRHAADDRGHPQSQCLGVRRQRLGDLLGQLPGRHEDQSVGLLRFRAPPGLRVSSGRPKASVLPDPVRPRPRTSRPWRASGSVAAWIGKGSRTPSALSVRSTSPGRFRPEKEAAGAWPRARAAPSWAVPESSGMRHEQPSAEERTEEGPAGGNSPRAQGSRTVGIAHRDDHTNAGH